MELVESNQQSDQVEQARKLHKRLKLHVGKTTDLYELKRNTAYSTWLNSYVSGGVLNNATTAERLEGFVNAPFVTTSATHEILREQKKIFNSPDSNLSLSFRDQGNKSAFLKFLEEQGEKDLYPNEAFYNWALDPNGFYVMEPPREGDETPFSYWVPSSTVICPCIDTMPINGKQYVKWLYYQYYHPEYEDVLMFVDDVAFYLIGNDGLIDTYPHGQEKAPVHQLGKSPINGSDYLKGNSISPLFDDLDYLAVWAYSRRYNETGNAWPYIITVKHSESYEQQVENNNASTRNDERSYSETWGAIGTGSYIDPRRRGKKTQGNFVLGAQLELEGNAMGDGENPIKPSEAVHRMGPENVSLEYGHKREEELIKGLLAKALGNTNLVNDQAVNEMQASGVFSSAQAKLNDIKPVFESLRTWWIYTMATYIYPNDFQGVSYTMGTRNFLYTESELAELRKKMVEAGASKFALASIDSLINETVANKTGRVSRNEMLLHLDPLGGKEYNPEIDSAILSGDESIITQRLEFLVRKWERDNEQDITMFMPDSPMGLRVKALTDEILRYVTRNNTDNGREGQGAPENDSQEV